MQPNRVNLRDAPPFFEDMKAEEKRDKFSRATEHKMFLRFVSTTNPQRAVSQNECMRTILVYDGADFEGVENAQEFFKRDLEAILGFCIRNFPNAKKYRLRLAWDSLFDAGFWPALGLPELWSGYTAVVNRESTNINTAIREVVGEFMDKLVFYFYLETRTTKNDEADFRKYLMRKIAQSGLVVDLCNADTCNEEDHDPEIVARLMRDQLDGVLRFFKQ